MSRSATVRGGALLVAAMAGFALSDAAAKQLSASLPPVVLAWCRYCALLVTVLPLCLCRPTILRTSRPGWQAARALALVGSAVLFLLALQQLPIAEATAMVFASPLFVTSLAVLVLRERIPRSRWLPVGLGFVGVLIVVRPGAGVFGGAALFPLLSSACWAVAVVCTRKLSNAESAPTTMLYSGLFGTAALSLLLPALDTGQMLGQLPLLAGMTAAWCAAQWLTIAAYRTAAAATIAPFAYSQLVWAALLGLAVFGHVPDAVSIAGMGVILASGALAAWQPSTKRQTHRV